MSSIDVTVSIIVPVYKVENEINRCLLSIMQQDYDHIELILVNDCTPDNSFFLAKKLIDNYIHKLSSIVYVEHESNKGVSAARNTGINCANGDYVFFIDSDDELISGDVISSLVSTAKKYFKPDLIQGGHRRLDQCGKEIKSFKLKEEFFSNNNRVYEKYDRSICLYNDYAPGKLIKRSFLEQKKLYFKENIYYEDTLWGFFLYRNVDTFVTASKLVFNYYKREGSITSNITKKHISDFNTVLAEMYTEFLNSNNYYPLKTQKEIERRRRESIDRMKLLPDMDEAFILEEIERLRGIKISPFTEKFSYFRQNILFRLPKFFIYFIFFKKG